MWYTKLKKWWNELLDVLWFGGKELKYSKKNKIAESIIRLQLVFLTLL